MSTANKFLIPINSKIFDLGYKRHEYTKGLFVKKCFLGVAYLDYRNIGYLPRSEQVEEGPLFYYGAKKPNWLTRRTRNLQKKLLEENKIKFRSSNQEEFLEKAYGKGNGYCKFCKHDFQDEGLFCSKECELMDNNRVHDFCHACFGPFTREERIIEHHVNYFPEEIVTVHASCHFIIHMTWNYPHLRPKWGEADRFYQKTDEKYYFQKNFSFNNSKYI